MKFNGLTVFSLILGTFSLSLDRNKRQADLTETATTLPSADIARRYAGAQSDSDFTASNTESYAQVLDRKEHNFSHSVGETAYSSFYERDPQQNYNSEDEQADFNAITTVKPQPPPSYFARYLTRRSTGKYETEVKNEDSKNPFSQDWSDLYCPVTEKINVDESTKESGNEPQNFTEKNLNEIAENEETTDATQYENTQERSIDASEIESSGQVLDTDYPTRFHLDLENMLLNTTKPKRESTLNQNIIEEDQTSMPQLDVDYPNQKVDEYDYEQLLENAPSPSNAVRLLYGISYLYSIIQEGPSNVSKMVRGFFQ